jgi:hypothetical protein
MNNRKSLVWQYTNRQGNKVYCSLCSDSENNEFCCNDGTRGSVGRHLMTISVELFLI